MVYITAFTLRADQHSTMMNITSRLAIRLRYLPQGPIDWSSTEPQRSRESLTISDFLPSEDDATELKKRETDYIMRFLVQEFKELEKLKKFAPEPQPLHCVQKTEAVPMKALFKDEKYISETIDVLSTLMEDGGFSGSSQVMHIQ